MAAVWLQDWCGKRFTPTGERLWWNWALDSKTYPGWEEMHERIAPVRLLTYVNSMLSDPSEEVTISTDDAAGDDGDDDDDGGGGDGDDAGGW